MTLEIRRTLEETVSIALVLLLWAVLSTLAMGDGRVQFAVLVSGLVMAGLYAVVRGVALSSDADPAYEDPDAESVLVQNGRALLVAVPWFVLALVVAVVAEGAFGLVFPFSGSSTFVRRSLATLVQVFAFTGALSVLLVAVATGTRALRSVRTL